MERRTDWYAHPEFYEAIFGADTVKEVDFLLALHARYGNGGRRWLEPACGAGRLVEECARRGLTIAGYDVSPQMLAHAATRLAPRLRRRVRLAEGRMESFAPRALQRRVDFAFNLVATFRYLLTEKAARDHLACVRRMLAPGGLYALGFHLTDYARATPEKERWTGRAGRDRVVCRTAEGVPNRRTRRSSMTNRLRVRGPGRDWLIETDWKFRNYDARQFARLVERAGLKVRAIFTFDYDLRRPIDENDERLDRVYVLEGK
jgi:SAM-dependent methyltransferase